MHGKSFKNVLVHFLPTGVTFLILGSVLVYEHIKINSITEEINTVTANLASTTLALSVTRELLTKNVTDLTKETKGLSHTLTSTQKNVEAVKTQVGGVEQSVGAIGGTVTTLQKLSQVDPQLLKKYSKVYFTNENYTPLHTTVIPVDYTYSSTRQEQFLSESWPFLNQLLEDAKRSGITLFIKSGYRSFAEQKSLKSAYAVVYGAGTANAFSADQGYSEHQLGTTIDFIMTGQGGNLSGFDKTSGYEWLTANAYRYGFILSYPKGNSYYVYEPWHWRFVGVKLATYLHDTNRHFYDLDQREIDTYLVNTFDK
jgi:LAS superfamily LD-carboxypeptidase LdcB